MRRCKILIVEDDKDICELMQLQLIKLGHEVAIRQSGSEGFKLIKSHKDFDLYILDWMLPEVSGVELCQIIRSDQELRARPILMVTALTNAEHIVQGLDSGADDYITKPFNLSEFDARVRALLRRNEIKEPAIYGATIDFDKLSLSPSQIKVWYDGQDIHLTQSEFKILYELMKRPGHVFTRKQLYQSLQGPNTFATERTIDTHMAGLRKKIGEGSIMIETIRGVGYRFNGN